MCKKYLSKMLIRPENKLFPFGCCVARTSKAQIFWDVRSMKCPGNAQFKSGAGLECRHDDVSALRMHTLKDADPLCGT